MRLTVVDGDTLVGPGGITFGRLTAIEIELVEEPRELTPTEVRRITECPFCEVAIGAYCVRWRGGDRKANHMERVVEALARSRGGERVPGLTSTATSTAKGQSVEKEEETGVKKLGRPTASQLEAAAVARVWEHYLTVIPSKRKLDSKRRRIIVGAINLVGEDAVKLAVTGLSRSPHHNGENEQRRSYLEIRYALKGIGDESDDERIEKAISWAALHAPGKAPVSAAKVERWLEEVRYTASQPHHPERQRGLHAWRMLKGSGFNVIALDRPPWARIER